MPDFGLFEPDGIIPRPLFLTALTGFAGFTMNDLWTLTRAVSSK